jgi:hypothetical protein
MTTPTAAECATARTRLAEADEALHNLRMGVKAVRVRSGEHEVEYTPATEARLERYVQRLRALVALCDGSCRSVRRVIPVIPTEKC